MSKAVATLPWSVAQQTSAWSQQARGCLSRSVPDNVTLPLRVHALEAERNARQATIAWQFTARQARTKLKRLSPVISAEQG